MADEYRESLELLATSFDNFNAIANCAIFTSKGIRKVFGRSSNFFLNSDQRGDANPCDEYDNFESLEMFERN